MLIININLTRQFHYPIVIGNNLHENIKIIKRSIIDKISNIILITNKTLFNLYFLNFKIIFNKYLDKEIDNIIISDNESNKKINTVEYILKYLFQKRYGRDTLLLSLGGGIIGDICGIVASIYYRGIYLISIPTTLLSQVDASLGGKNGVNTLWGKNLIGTFFQPSAVIINLPYLYSLSTNSFKDGLAEILKYAIAFDKSFFYWLEKNIYNILNLKKKFIEFCIKKCCNFKGKVIKYDELEKYDNRILLNLGHTYAHALETYFKYKIFTHGQAVSLGIILSMYTSNIMGFVTYKDIQRVINIFKQIDLPASLPKIISIERYLKIMMHDKKIDNGKLSLIIPKNIGKCKIYRNISKNLIFLTLKKIFKTTHTYI